MKGTAVAEGRGYLLIGAVWMILYLCLLPLGDQLLVKRQGFHSGGVRLIRDDWDRSAYYQRGSWLALGNRPYIDTRSEYPPLATFFFGLGHLITDQKATYLWLHSLMMAGLYLMTLLLMLRLCRRLGLWAWCGYPLLLPGFCYFTVNRYDIFPCCLVLAALCLLVEKRRSASFAVLAAAAMVKWYPFLLIAPFAGYLARKDGLRTLRAPLAAFLLVLIASNLPVMILGGAGSASHMAQGDLGKVRAFMTGGLKTVLYPILWQAGSNENLEGLLPYAYMLQHALKLPLDTMGSVKAVFFVLQFGGFLLSLLLRPRTLREVIDDSTVCLMFFVLFSKVYSPQWLIWYIPLICLSGKAGERPKLLLYDAVSYMVLTVGYDVFGPGSLPHLLLTTARHVLFFWFLTPRARNMLRRVSRQEAPSLDS